MRLRTYIPVLILAGLSYSCGGGGGSGGGGGGGSPPGNNNPGDGGTPTALCIDGIDNDGDGLVDMLDPGCDLESDNDETAPLPDFSSKQDYFSAGLFTGDTAGLDSLLGQGNRIRFRLTASDFRTIYDSSEDASSSLADTVGDFINAKYGSQDLTALLSAAINNLVDNPADKVRLLNDFAVYGGLDSEGDKFVAFYVIDEDGKISYAFIRDNDEFERGLIAYGVSEFYSALDTGCASADDVMSALEQDYLIPNAYNYQIGQEALIVGGAGDVSITPDLYLIDLDLAIWYLDGTEDPAEIERQRQACEWFQTYILPGFRYEFVTKTSNESPAKTAENELIDIIEGN